MKIGQLLSSHHFKDPKNTIYKVGNWKATLNNV